MRKAEGTKELSIRNVRGFVTNVDWADLSENYALRTRGFRFEEPGMVGRRDYGTKHRYALYPSKPGTITMVDGYSLYNRDTQSEHDVVFGYDPSLKSHVLVNDSSYAQSWDTGNWIEMTSYYYGWIYATPSGDTAVVTITSYPGDDVPGIMNISGTRVYLSTNQMRDYIIWNETKNEYAFVVSSTYSNVSTMLTVTLNRYASANYLGWEELDVVRFYKNSVLKTAYEFNNGATPHVRWAEVSEQAKVNLYYGTSATPSVMNKPLRIQRIASDRTYFPGANNSPTLHAGWWMDQGGGGLIPAYAARGSSDAPVTESMVAGSGKITGGPGSVVVYGDVDTEFFAELKIGSLIRVSGNYYKVERIYGPGESGYPAIELDAEPPLVWTAVSFDRSTLDATYIGDGNGYDWLNVSAHPVKVSVGGSYNFFYRYAIMCVYDGYQFSDLIYKVYAYSDTVGYDLEMSLAFAVRFETMPKNITGLRIYAEKESSETYASHNEWPDAPADYKFLYEVNFTEASSDSRTWKGRADSEPNCVDFNYMFSPPMFDTDFLTKKFAETSNTLAGDLNHAVDTNRSYLTPRYSARARRAQQAIGVVDESDSVLRVSNYNGDGVHEDDNFPDVTVDDGGEQLKIYLLSRGELLGLIFQDDVLFALKQAEIEAWDFQSGFQRTVEADVIAKRSIISTPYGMFWAGESGIYQLERGSYTPRIINTAWKNLYDGTLKAATSSEMDAGSAYVTSAYRRAAIAGYDPKYQEVWFHLQTNIDEADGGGSEYLCYRYSPRREIWNVRKLNIGSSAPVKWFTRRNDQSLSIGYASGILLYPNIESSYPWQEEVLSTDGDSSKGFETDLLLHCGSIYSVARDFIAEQIYVDQEGDSSLGVSQFYLRVFANKEITAYDEKEVSVDDPIRSKIGLLRRGIINRLRVQIQIPTSATNKFRYWNINTIVLDVIPKEQLGTR